MDSRHLAVGKCSYRVTLSDHRNQWKPGLTEQFTCFVTCPHVRAVHIHLQTASQLWMLNLRDAAAAELQHIKPRGMAVGLLWLETPEKGVQDWATEGKSHCPSSIPSCISRENTFDRSLTKHREARQAARHRWHSRWRRSSQLVWSQCCILLRCFQGLSWTDLWWWMLFQTKVLLHTKDGERLLISLTLQSSLRLSPHLSGSEGGERMPLVKTSHMLQLVCL